MNDIPLTRPQRGRPKVLSDAHQRGRALAALRQVLAEHGYAGATMDMVARAAGLSKKTLYDLFESKEQLFAALVVAHRATMVDLPRPASDQPLADELAAIFRLDMGADEALDRHALVQLMIGEARHTPDLSRILTAHGPMASRALLADWLAREQARGRLRPADAGDTAAVLMGLMFSTLVPKPFEPPGPDSASERRRQARLAIAIFLDGAAPR